MAEWQRADHFVKEADHILVVSHIDPDGDAVSSTLAMAKILRQREKKVTMVNASSIPKKFSFLPGVENILLPQQVSERFSNVVTVDCADAKRVGECVHLYTEKVNLLNIDHHVTNDYFGDVNIVIDAAAATVEILFEWIERWQLAWDGELAKIIYTGILADTGGFRYSNTTSELLRKAARLLEVGIQADRIAHAVLDTITRGQIQLLQIALSTLRCSEDGLVAWMTLRLVDLNQMDITSEEAEGIVHYARNMAGVEVGVLFWEKEEMLVKVSLRSQARVDVAAVAKQLGGGGHIRAAGCTVQGTVEQVQTKALALVFKELAGEKE
jgi:bifunctional oligoribonuclease and PAP phosphatase NrnA